MKEYVLLIVGIALTTVIGYAISQHRSGEPEKELVLPRDEPVRREPLSFDDDNRGWIDSNRWFTSSPEEAKPDPAGVERMFYRYLCDYKAPGFVPYKIVIWNEHEARQTIHIDCSDRGRHSQ